MTNRRTIYWQGAGWLILLVPFFFISYGQVNVFTAGRSHIGSLVYEWEQHIPFVPLTIIPYWSLDVLYGVSLFVCTSLTEQRRLVCRLVLASLIACAGFLLFPLRFTFTRPEITGLAGWLFSQLEQFDLPYNQSPSLHIILSWLLWRHYHQHLTEIWQTLSSGWFMLIAISVLTTWQHHVIDVITGLAVGIVIDWLIPQRGRWHWRWATGQRRVLAIRYLCGAIVCLCGTGLTALMWWPALALLIVALAYGVSGVSALQKDAKGRLTPPAWILLLPWRLGLILTRHFYRRRLPAVSSMTDGVFFGAYPSTRPSQQAVLDLTCEFPRASTVQGIAYSSVPMLDLVKPDLVTLGQAAEELERLRTRHGTVFVHCALGLSRSALVVAAWMLQRYPELSLAHVIGDVRRARPQVVLTSQHMELLEIWKIKLRT